MRIGERNMEITDGIKEFIDDIIIAEIIKEAEATAPPIHYRVIEGLMGPRV